MKISPSVLAADFSRLAADVARVEQAGVDMLHLDVMDGNFVPNITFGAPVIKALRPHSALLFDVHLMIDRPERYIADFIKAGADSITVHYESTAHPAAVLEAIREAGLKAAVSVSPKTPIEVVYPLLPLCDMVLVMTVEPGFGGQKLIPHTLDKVRALRAEIESRGLSVDIQADGGINDDTLADVLAAGVNVIVAGSSIFGATDPAAAIAKCLCFFLKFNQILILCGHTRCKQVGVVGKLQHPRDHDAVALKMDHRHAGMGNIKMRAHLGIRNIQQRRKEHKSHALMGEQRHAVIVGALGHKGTALMIVTVAKPLQKGIGSLLHALHTLTKGRVIGKHGMFIPFSAHSAHLGRGEQLLIFAMVKGPFQFTYRIGTAHISISALLVQKFQLLLDLKPQPRGGGHGSHDSTTAIGGKQTVRATALHTGHHRLGLLPSQRGQAVIGIIGIAVANKKQ